MGKQTHETVEAHGATAGQSETEETKGMFHRHHRGIFHLHRSKEDKDDNKKENEEKKKDHVSKREKVAAAIAGLGTAGKALKKVMRPHRGGGGGGRGEEEEEEVEEEEGEGEDGVDEEEEEEEEDVGGFIEGLVTLISEAFEG